ncbi:MAG: hypothetical protein N2438_06865, partial [Limisphaera sp.]|nr:hypothetical protein [Limisphaera sp.]
MRHISAFSRIALLVSTTLVATAAAGAETDRVQALEERLRQMQAQFEQTLREQRQQIEALQRELAELKQSSTPLPPDSARVPSVGEASLPSPDVSAATPQT